ncbi:MAG: prolipoprotein diacylglyceryl transferase, partial [Bacteroidaceae bacterium]|nr:prolipoprotein diacylglyceryl transferase [Bacteroidaceae bacterium]MCF0189488.1 prolipoprotein diacylglyceryl transferase [Bacteroidaceae bacterium]
GQLYEALTYLALFFVGLWIYRMNTKGAGGFARMTVGTGWYFGWCIFSIFTARIFIEYTKEVQEAFEEGMLFNMGQLLSVPFVLLGAYCMFRKSDKKQAKS